MERILSQSGEQDADDPGTCTANFRKGHHRHHGASRIPLAGPCIDTAHPRGRGDRMSNCGVRSRGSMLPCSIVANHGIESSDHLSHDGDDNDFGFLVGRGETEVEDFKDGIVPSCVEGSHVEHVTDRHAAAIDAAMSFELATVEVVRRKSDESSDLLAAHLPELWQESD